MIVTVMINYVLLSCEYNDIDNKITRLWNNSLYFAQTSIEPSEAEDPDYTSRIWGRRCAWWVQWKLLSE